ncbi:MAG: hypothetical protein ABIZ80_15870 [Bryobacteraceae bacterium]
MRFPRSGRDGLGSLVRGRLQSFEGTDGIVQAALIVGAMAFEVLEPGHELGAVVAAAHIDDVFEFADVFERPGNSGQLAGEGARGWRELAVKGGEEIVEGLLAGGEGRQLGLCAQAMLAGVL